MAAALLVLAVAGGVGCTEKSSTDVGRLAVDGRAEVITAEGDRSFVTGGRTLHSGDQVRVLDGTGELALGSGRKLELRKGSVLRLGVETGAPGAAGTRPELVSGDALVASRDEASSVLVGSTEVQVQGVTRISRTLTVVVAVYEGAAGVESAGRSASVPALRQVTVAAPGVLPRPSPLVPSPSDSWDQRYLGDAFELSNQLVARSKGFSAQLATGEGTTTGFFRQLLPGLDREAFDASLLGTGRAPGETLVGASIALAGKKGTFVARWTDVFDFHADGAPWGLVAADQGVNRSSVLNLVDAAIDRRSGGAELAAPPASAPTTPTTVPAQVAIPVPTTGGAGATPPATTTTPGTGSGSTGTGTGSGTGGANPGPAGGTTTGTVPGSDRGPVDLGLPIVDDTLNGVLDALSGLLNSLGK